MAQTIAQIEAELRYAAVARDYAAVERLAVLFSEAVEARTRALPPGDPAVAELTATAEGLLQWTTNRLLLDREDLSFQVRQLRTVKRYLPQPRSSTVALRVDG